MNKMLVFIGLLFVAVTFGATLNAQTYPVGAQSPVADSFSQSTSGLAFNWGWRFQVNASNVTIQSLGCWTPNSSTTGRTVSLFDVTTQSVIAQVATGSGAGWQHATLSTPLALVNGKQYEVVVYIPGGQPYYYKNTSSSGWRPTGAIQYLQSRYVGSATANTFTTSGDNTFVRGCADIGYSLVGPTVDSTTSASISDTSATLGGDVTSDNGSAITERGVVYSVTSTNADPIIGGTGVTKATTSGTTGVFTLNATGLSAGTQYSFRAFATNANGTAYTSASTFTTSDAPTIGSPTSTGVASTSATLGGNVTSDNGAAITERGVVYSITSTNADPLISGTGVTKATTTGTTGVFTLGATSLTAGTQYSFKAYAINSIGTTYTTVATFTTLDAPTISSPTSTGVSSTSATLGGDVTSDNGATITERGVVYSVTSTNADPLISGTGVTKTTTTGTTGVFTVGITSLTPGTQYSYKAYATNSVGTSYTTVSTFSTPATAPTVTSPTSASIGYTDATLGGDVTTDNGAAITERGVVYSITSTNADPLISGTGVTKATTTGTTGVFTLSATSLNSGTQYSFKAYAINSVGTTYTTVDTFSTLPPPAIAIGAPSVSVTAGTDVTFTITYTDAAAITLANGDVTVNVTGVTGTAAVSGTGSTTRTVTVSGITGDGSFTISIAAATASNPGGNAAAAGPSATVTVDNTKPSVTPAGTLTMIHGYSESSATVASVADTSTSSGNLVVTATNLPIGFAVNNISNSSGTISADIVTDTSAALGANLIEFTVTDEAGNTETANLQVDLTTNTAPTITGPTDQLVQINTATGTLNVTVSDADEGANALVLTVSSKLGDHQNQECRFGGVNFSV